MDGLDDSLSIGEVARRANLSVDAVRYYERERLLPPAARDSGGRRVYDVHVLDALEVVAALRGAGFGIGEVREFMAIKTPGSTEAQRLAAADLALSRLEEGLRRRAAALRAARTVVRTMRAELDEHRVRSPRPD